MKSTESKAKRRLLFVVAILMVVAIGVAYVLIDSVGWNSLSKYAILNGGTSIAACVVTAVLFWSSILEKHREDFREGGLFRIL